jgi:hypothetical protein
LIQIGRFIDVTVSQKILFPTYPNKSPKMIWGWHESDDSLIILSIPTCIWFVFATFPLFSIIISTLIKQQTVTSFFHNNIFFPNQINNSNPTRLISIFINFLWLVFHVIISDKFNNILLQSRKIWLFRFIDMVMYLVNNIN